MALLVGLVVTVPLGPPLQAQSAPAWTSPVPTMGACPRINSSKGPDGCLMDPADLEPPYDRGRPHKGADIYCTPNVTPVLAVRAGRVVVGAEVGYYGGGYGKLVLVDHGDGTASGYAHLNTIHVSAGARVVQGQPVGVCGTTDIYDYSRGMPAHTHVEIRVGFPAGSGEASWYTSTAIDPLTRFRLADAAFPSPQVTTWVRDSEGDEGAWRSAAGASLVVHGSADFAVDVLNPGSTPLTVGVRLPCGQTDASLAAGATRQWRCRMPVAGGGWTVHRSSVTARSPFGTLLPGATDSATRLYDGTFAPTLSVVAADGGGGPFAAEAQAMANSRSVYRIEAAEAGSLDTNWQLSTSEPACDAQLADVGERRDGQWIVRRTNAQSWLCSLPTGTNLRVQARVGAVTFPARDLEASARSGPGGAPPVPTRFVPLAPARLADTRPGTLTPIAGLPPGPLGGGAQTDTPVSLPAALLPPGVPLTAVRAIDVKLTSVDASAPGWLSAQAGAASGTSNLAYGAGQTTTVQATVAVAPGGRFVVTTGAGHRTHLVIDLLGVWVDGTVGAGTSTFVPGNPRRALDSRAAGLQGAPAGMLEAGRDHVLALRGFALADGTSIPAGATAVRLGLVTLGARSFGWYDLRPAGAPVRDTSSGGLLGPGQTLSSSVTVPLAADGAVALRTSTAGHFVIDVEGYYIPSERGQGLRFVPAAPLRISDTRTGTVTAPVGALESGARLDVPVATPAGTGRFQVPSVDAVVATITLLAGTGSCYVTAWSGEVPMDPSTSVANCNGDRHAANQVVVPLSDQGRFSADVEVTSPSTRRTVDLIVDLGGYFVP